MGLILYTSGYRDVGTYPATLPQRRKPVMAFKCISLPQDKVTIVDEYDYDWLNQWKWHCDKKDYVIAYDGGGRKNARYIRMHRVITNVSNNLQVDHINGDTLDNRRCNLRICTNQQNHRNKSKNFGNSLYKGVAWHKKAKKWEAYIKYNKKNHLGLFLTQEEAALAYNIAAKKYFGEFAKLNEIPNEGYSWNIL